LTEGRKVAPPSPRKEKKAEEKDCFAALFCASEPRAAPLDPETEKHLNEKDGKLKAEHSSAQTVFKGATDSKEIVKKAADAGVSYFDPDFPPTMDSLFKIDKLAAKKGFSTSPTDSGILPTIEWRRAKEFCSGGVKIFEGDIEFDDISQGQLGDCWLMCSIASLAENPVYVKDAIQEQECNTDTGLYVIKLFKDGREVKVVLDDYFPCYPKGGPIYSKANGPELWVMLLEKAYAKFHGSYAAIRSGFPYEALVDLTVSPIRCMNLLCYSNIC
jgi:hypothetical protein